MTDNVDDRVATAFEDHEAFEVTVDGYRVTTTAFEGVVTPGNEDDETHYTLVVRAPTLDAATDDYVGPAVADGWFETFERRLREATKATRVDLDLDAFSLTVDGDDAVATYEFTLDNPRTAADVAKTFVEYVEGTYVEGVVPGYNYRGVVADLLGRAASGEGEAERGGTPL